MSENQNTGVQSSTATRVAQRQIQQAVMKILMSRARHTITPEVLLDLGGKVKNAYHEHLKEHCPGYDPNQLDLQLAVGEAGAYVRPLNLATGLWLQGQYGLNLNELQGHPGGAQWYAGSLALFTYSVEEGLKVTPKNRIADLLGY